MKYYLNNMHNDLKNVNFNLNVPLQPLLKYANKMQCAVVLPGDECSRTPAIDNSVKGGAGEAICKCV